MLETPPEMREMDHLSQDMHLPAWGEGEVLSLFHTYPPTYPHAQPQEKARPILMLVYIVGLPSVHD
jgi:hypothetical protein